MIAASVASILMGSDWIDKNASHKLTINLQLYLAKDIPISEKPFVNLLNRLFSRVEKNKSDKETGWLLADQRWLKHISNSKTCLLHYLCVFLTFRLAFPCIRLSSDKIS